MFPSLFDELPSKEKGNLHLRGQTTITWALIIGVSSFWQWTMPNFGQMGLSNECHSIFIYICGGLTLNSVWMLPIHEVNDWNKYEET